MLRRIHLGVGHDNFLQLSGKHRDAGALAARPGMSNPSTFGIALFGPAMLAIVVARIAVRVALLLRRVGGPRSA